MFIKGLSPRSMTPIERAMGRFMRAPDHPGDDDQGLDNDDETDEDDDQSGEAEEDDNDDTDSNADDDDQDADDPDEGSREDERGKRTPKNGYEKRIARLTRQLAEARGAKPERADGGNVPATPPKKPVATDFDTYEDFVEALTEFKAEEIVTRREAKQSAQQAENEFQKTFKKGQSAYKDWDDVVTEDVEVTPPMLRAIKDSDNPADVAYYLGSNPDEAERIASLPPGKAVNAIAKIDGRFDKQKGKSERTSLREVSRAPDPITPLKGGKGSIEKDPDKMSADEFMEARNRALRTRKG